MVRSGVLFQLTLLCILPSSKEPEPMERTTATRDLFDCLVRINVLSKGNKPVVYTHVHHLSIHSTVKCLFSERQQASCIHVHHLSIHSTVKCLFSERQVVYMYITCRFTPLLNVSSPKGNKPVVVSHAWPISIKCTRGLFRYCLHEYNLTIICKSLN